MGSVAGKLALVTGGGGGLGAVAVATLIELGAEKVTVVGRTRGKLDELCRRFPGRVEGAVLDVTKPEAWRELTDSRFDILVSAAGVTYRESFLDSSYEHWMEILGVNTVGTMLAAKTVLPGMLARGWGRIVLISSVAAKIGLAERAVYSASKAALEAWARAVAAEIGGHGVLINSVAPGMFPTDLTSSWLAANPEKRDAILKSIPEHRFGQPEELATVLRFLFETNYAQGSVVYLDGGWGVV